MHPLLERYRGDERVAHAIRTLQNTQKWETVKTNTSYDSILLSLASSHTGGTHLALYPTQEEAQRVYEDLKKLQGNTALFFFQSSIEVKNKTLEISNANKSAQNIFIAESANIENKIIITYYQAALEKFIIPEDKSAQKTIYQGDRIQIQEMIEDLEHKGYSRENFVYEQGQYAIRGNIIDIYSYSSSRPFRIELFDIEVEEMRYFDIETQLSIETVVSAKYSSSPLRIQQRPHILRTILDYARGQYFWGEDIKAIENKLKEELRALTKHPVGEHVDIQNTLIQEPTIHQLLSPQYHVLYSQNIENDKISPTPVIHKNINKLAQTIKSYHQETIETVILSEEENQESRYRQIFSDLGAPLDFVHYSGELSSGFVDLEAGLAVFTTHEIFAKKQYHSNNPVPKSSAQAQLLKSIQELVPGDYVTHIDHGVGRFSGLEKIEVNGHTQEAVRLIYANNDILYVHISSLYKISKYQGKEGIEPKMNRLGSDTWDNIKRKTKKKIKDIAEDLIKLYAKRKATSGHAFPSDNYLQYELETAFEYEDTPDQAKASQEVKTDMEKPIPMDRLICGDVGFGKTEVAIRAAFKAVSDSKQVAVLVPTTLLAFQHYLTFKKRLQGFPVNVDFINRFKTTKQKNEVLEKLEKGSLDILIGTHAIVGKNVKFKDLGLLIIDEEQKFGVAIKEKLKQWKLNVDTLTLTATPIPRTLQFSLMGARDYSLIQTPPPSRQNIYTEVTSFDPNYVQEIIQNETMRGGQVFFVQNKIKDLNHIYEILIKILPDISIALVHGQMDGEYIEQTLLDFMDKKYDVLLSTNIIESGIDIPNANTIIINNAHQFGLSDLHQLRGRVGRSHQKAYCYLLSPPYSTLTREAKQRLQAMEQNAALGAGFQIAMRDLDLRGAGNLLGAEQSGFMSDIGYDTFMKILDEAITELKEGEYKDLYQEDLSQENKDYAKECQIETDVDMYIPDGYIATSQDRMKVYSELNKVKSEKELTAYLKQVEDVYGSLPPQVKEISEVIHLKWVATKLGIERIIVKSTKMRCYLIQNQESRFYESRIFQKILDFISQQGHGASIKQTNTHIILEFSQVKNTAEARTKLNEIQGFIHQ